MTFDVSNSAIKTISLANLYSTLNSASPLEIFLAAKMSEDTVVVSLSDIDHMGGDMVSITVALIMHHVDVQALKEAADRVVEKWRLLAGRVKRNPSSPSAYQIQVPLGPLSKGYRRVDFTEATQMLSVRASFPPSSSSEALLLYPPAIKLFRHPDTPNSLKALCSRRATLLSIHVTHLPDHDCIGLTFPHGVFDGFGMAHVLHGLTSELHGREWTPFPLNSKRNVLDEEIAALREQDSLADPMTRKELLRGFTFDWATFNLKNLLKFGASVAYEILLQKAERRAIFLSADTVAQLVHRVRAGEKDRPSTSDILYAWFFKVGTVGSYFPYPC